MISSLATRMHANAVQQPVNRPLATVKTLAGAAVLPSPPTQAIYRSVRSLAGVPVGVAGPRMVGEPTLTVETSSGPSTGAIVWSVLSTAAIGASAYHGYKRNDSVGWAIVWGLLGGMFPVITVPVAFAQGYAKPAKS